ncbi:hypothetical protein BOTBODRAFT_30755 [Botryobasidium botryosum FD-172 SS1]|uniref:ABC transporter domain-containing protein n=1 Tax=Botryobasidium botryosum (strain FD-172 SS1) TaxID=930990 RepID=A0A067MYC5_BOTB1|nr:hypothetical protein BOTBODRAFT_30755 [Botryobasidium botryosum FD-172 SS1]
MSALEPLPPPFDAIDAKDTSPADVQVLPLNAPPANTDHLVPAASTFMAPLPPPPPFDLRVSNLTIGTPARASYLPFPVSSPLPTPARALFGSSANNSGKTEFIIRDVSVTCKSGEMTAIIGGSGSGKTTLLNAIVGRLSNLPKLQGEVTFVSLSDQERKALDIRSMKDRIGYVRQNDFLLAHLTVRETLEYAAALRLPASITAQTRKLIVDQTIEELGLQDAVSTVVGGALRKGISGGERRRLTIGCVLVTLPSILCLDEPTTGLDSFTAHSLLRTLSNLAHRNRTVILSLHQPRSDAFSLFSRIVLLSRGSVVYSGPTVRCLPWFGKLGYVPEKDVNPLDWLIDVSSVDTGHGDLSNPESEKENESARRVSGLIRAWDDGGKEVEDMDSGVLNARANLCADAGALVELFNPRDRGAKRPGHLRQTLVLLGRSYKNHIRNYEQMLGFGCQAIIIGLVSGGVYFRLGESPADILSLKTLCYTYIPCYNYLTLVYFIYRYCEIDLVVFDREREDRLYSVAPWVLAEFFANLPTNVFFTSVYAIILYLMANMRTDGLAGDLFLFVAINVLLQLSSIGLSLLITSIIRVYATAALISNMVLMFFIPSAGFVLVHLPVYVVWVRWISLYFYGFRAIAISQFRDRHFTCEGVVGAARNQCDGNQVLVGLHIPKEHSVGVYAAGLIGLFIAFQTLAGIILTVYHPGDVKHAARIDPDSKAKSSGTSDMDVVRARVDIEVRDLSFRWIRPSLASITERQEKTILENVNARFPAGKVTAILGPSGAGKSTLLQLLASRRLNAGPLAQFQTTGAISLNDQPLTGKVRVPVAFVEQDDDYHLPGLTVRETLRYAAILRLPSSMSRKRKHARVEEVLQMLGLLECADNLVGGPLLKGISGGEKRRLSLAVQMINDPSILLTDEPTSGLDSHTANSLMSALKGIASSGRTVIVSLHQPRSDIYLNKIDHLLVLARGGRVVYSGPRDQVESILQSIGYPVPPHYNPADWLLDLVSVDPRGQKKEQSEERVRRMIDYWSAVEKETGTALDSSSVKSESVGSIEQDAAHSRMTPAYIAIPIVVERMVRNLWRQQQVFWTRLVQGPAYLLVLMLFFQRLSLGPEGGQDRIGFTQQIVLALGFIGLLASVATYPTERDLYIHEYKSDAAYSPWAFVVAFTLVELPLQIMGSLLLAVVGSIGIERNTDPRVFFEFFISAWALQSTGESFGIVFASLSDTMGLSVSLVSTTITVLSQINGIMSESIPHWLEIISWGTTMKYATSILFINACRGIEFNCSAEAIASGECFVQNGEELLGLVGLHDWRTGRYAGIMVALAILYRAIAWGFVKLRLRRA